MNIKTLLSELEKLNLPKNKFAITSSGSLAIRNIREANDLDLIVYPELWQFLSKKYKVIKEDDLETIYIGNIQILGNGSYFTDPKFGGVINQINNADIIDGFRYVKLDTITEIKKSMSRPKDLVDIKLIEKYLSENQKIN